MKKFCIISTVDVTRMSISSLYIKYLESKGVVCDVVTVKKFDESKKMEGVRNQYEFDTRKTRKYSFIRKYLYFRKLVPFFDKINRENQYDFIIVWNELTTFIFANYLKKHFTNRYCVNIRDYQFFRVPLVNRRISKALNNSYFSTSSSAKYFPYFKNIKKPFLPFFSMNFNLLKSLNNNRPNDLKGEDQINILYIGQVQWLKYAYKFVDVFANNPKFNLIFAGTGSESITQYIEGKNISNIEVYGRFLPGEESKFLNRADIFYNLYGAENKHLQYALSIKLYYAVYLSKPILTIANTYTDELARDNMIGITTTLEEMDHLPIDVEKFIEQFDYQKVKQKCDESIKNFEENQKKIFAYIDEVINK